MLVKPRAENFTSALSLAYQDQDDVAFALTEQKG